MNPRLFGRDQIFPLILISVALGALAICMSWPEPAAFQQVSSKVWPMVIAGAILIVALAIFLENLRNPRERSTVEEVDPDGDVTTAGPQGWILVGALVAAAQLLEFLGFWLALTFLLGVTGWLIEAPGHRPRAIATAVVLPGAVFLLFTQVFSQYLPLGLMDYLPSWLPG